MVEVALALVVVAVALVLARRQFLVPADYLIAAGLTLLLTMALVPNLPNVRVQRELVTIGAPRPEFLRNEFLRARGPVIVLAGLLTAFGFVASAVVRGRTAHRIA